LSGYAYQEGFSLVGATPVEETDPEGRRRMSGGKQSTCGTPQGGVISPLLANRYMNRFLRHWRQQGRGETFRAHVVNYADDRMPRTH
jgi:RNA-directed DNA polymerase